MNQKIDISIVIVSYNVKDLLKNCIDSIFKSNTNLKYEVIVVDNDSKDSTIDNLSPLFPEVNFIQTGDNLGFSKANNIGFEESKGDYILILNPDTILALNTLQVMFYYMQSNPKTGAAGCKILNEDGSFQLACRRGFPTPWNSFCKLFGLQSLFPNIKLFSGYNLTYLSIDETYPVDVLIGAFIFCRKEVIDQTDGFDEDFFMYGEDIDLCKRIKDNGWEIDYVNTTTTVHLKGESTKRSEIDEVKHFYNAMKIYIKKNHKNSAFFLAFMNLGIIARSTISYIFKYKFDFLLIFIDAFLLFVSFLIANQIRFNDLLGFPTDRFSIYLIILVVTFFISSFANGVYFENKYSNRRQFSSVITAGILIGFFTYTLRKFDLSRWVLLISSINFFGFSILIRQALKKIISRDNYKVALIGDDNLSFQIDSYLKKVIFNTNMIYSGNLSIGTDIKNDIVQLEKLLIEKEINELVISSNSNYYNLLSDKISHKLKDSVTLTHANNWEDFLTKTILSKSIGLNNFADSTPLKYPRFKILKRISDCLYSLIFLSIGLPFINLLKTNNGSVFVDLLKVFIGKKSFVGISKDDGRDYYSKEGLLSISSISETQDDATTLNLNKYYEKNYSLGLDLQIITKALLRKK